MRSLGYWSVPRWAAMSRSPFWPPSEPPGGSGTCPRGGSGRRRRQDILGFQLVEPDDLADRPTAQVHEGLGLQQQDAAVVDLDLGELAFELAGERGSSRRGRG